MKKFFKQLLSSAFKDPILGLIIAAVVMLLCIPFGLIAAGGWFTLILGIAILEKFKK